MFKKKPNLIRKLNSDGYVYLKNNSVSSFLPKIRKIVKKNFNLKTNKYLSMETEEFHNLILKTLNSINKNINLKKMQKVIAKQFSETLSFFFWL